MLIAEGHTAQELAAVLGVTIFTIRAHIRAIFAKTGVTRQAALVRVVLSETARARSPMRRRDDP